MSDSRSAAAPSVTASGAGVGVPRRYTSADKHPFDCVEWEIRDAVIGDPAKPAFEQRGVEFPVSWSQNATNIVAQKYFRGRLDSPERESSVRQMVGRVAGTIAGWGREGGYFATDEDAQAFEDELTHILLNQMAAFNSPVWFNVGFEENPQCSACQPFHARVSTPEGLVPIGEIVERGQIGREVYDANGTTRVVAVKANGRKPVMRVKLRNGSYVEATPDHVVKAVAERRTAPKWLRVDQLQPGMRLHLHPHRAKVASEVLVPAGETTFEADPLAQLDETPAERRIATAEAALAGWLQADGFVGQYPDGTNRSLTVEFQVAGDEEFAWVMDNLDVALPHVHRHVRDVETLDDSTQVRRVRLYGEVLREFVEDWELLDRGTEIRVPDRLWTAGHEEISAYLRSVFQADGYVSVRRDAGYENCRIAVAVIAERWTEDIQLLLNTLGIYSRRTRKVEPRPDRHDLYEVSISIGSERARFAEIVGFVSERKQRRLIESLELRNPKRCPDLREEEIVAIEDLGVMDVFDIQTESGEYLSNNIAVHNCFILSVEDTMESILAWNTKEGMIFRGGSGSGINLSKIRGSQEHLSKGGLASGPVSFMRGADAWAGTIKSGGKTRRAAKMVVLDVDHPDVLDFIWCKAREEEKAAALRDAGFDMRLDSEHFASIQYQNANNSVRVTDEFMERAEHGEEWELTARNGDAVLERINARELLNQIADAAWRCADPGVQYDTTINEWHTCPNSGRINASNPCCFTGDTLVESAEGPVPFAELHARAVDGDELPLVEAYDHASGEPTLRAVNTVWIAGHTSDLVDVFTEGGQVLRCTPDHRFLTADGRYREARALSTGDLLRALTSYDAASGPVAERVMLSTTERVTSVRRVTLSGPVPVYDLEVDGLHNFAVRSEESGDSIVVHNSEYMHVDDSACNLASLNLMKFRRPDGTFDVEGFEHAVDVMILAQEIVVGPSSYPTEEIGRNARAFRQLGLGYANLGALLMANGVAYDSDEGRALCGAITALMTGRAYRTSAEIAGALGPYERYEENRDPHNHVMRKHRRAAYSIDDELCADESLLAAARRAWDEAVDIGVRNGYRNAQATVLAPTGTISFLMDCDTTGIEPDFSLVKFKELVGGGQMTIVNRTVPLALETLGYTEGQIVAIEEHLAANGSLAGASELAEEHLPVFDVAVGQRAIAPMGHIKMMAAAQPFISGAISKTVNLPESVTVEDIAGVYTEGWKLGLKALAIYRDGSKTAQALRTDAGEKKDAAADATLEVPRPVRRRMPRERQSLTHKFSVGGHEGYITAGEYDDGTLGEIFLTDIGKEGSTIKGLMNAFATAISIGLQYGVPIDTFVRKFAYVRFEPEGYTGNPEIPFAKSMPDYIMRWLASRYCDADLHEELGILTPEVRARKAAQEALMRDDTAGPPAEPETDANGGGNGHAKSKAGGGSEPKPAAAAFTDEPPAIPAKLQGLDLGPACAQCGGMMQRTGSCYTCSSCGNNTGCG
jgi:ribonucleotide reductase alpha subunit